MIDLKRGMIVKGAGQDFRYSLLVNNHYLRIGIESSDPLKNDHWYWEFNDEIKSLEFNKDRVGGITFYTDIFEECDD